MQIKRLQMHQMVVNSDKMLTVAIKTLVSQEHPYVIEGLPEDILDEMVGNGVKTARGYGISGPDESATFVLLMFEFGPEFHLNPVIQKTLRDASIPSDLRLSAVIERTPSETWEQIQSTLHEQTWFPELDEPDED